MSEQNPYAAPTAEVRDAPTDDSMLAGRGARLGASFLDGLVAFLLVYLPMIVVVGFGGMVGESGQFNYALLLSGAVLLACLPGALLLIGLTWWLVHRNGQTIGKKLVGIKVVRGDSSRATVARIFWVRNVPFWVLSIIPVVGSLISLVDALMIFRSSRQCLHDQLADTIVIRA